jgi:DNA polymerase-3 subunit gamma/tau
MEKVGAALIEVRQAPDPRVPIEIALLQLARADGDDSAALLQRIEKLEQQVEALGAGRGRTPTAEQAQPAVAAPPPRPSRGSASRDAIIGPDAGDNTRSAPQRTPAPASRPDPTPAAVPASSPSQGEVDSQLVGSFTLGEVTEHLPAVLESLPQKVRARFRQGQPIEVQDGVITFAYPNQLPADRAIDVKGELERAMSAQFKCPVRVEVIVDPSKSGGPPSRRSPRQSAPAPSDSEEDIGPISELKDADGSSNTMVDRLTSAFPGAKLIDPPPASQ